MSIVIETETQWNSIFVELQETLDGISYVQPLTEFQYDFAAATSLRFGMAVSPTGELWAELAPETIRRKGSDRILVDTGALRASLVEIGGVNNISVVADRGSIYGTSDPKAIWHQFGTRRMPARPMVGTTEAAVDTLAERIADFVITTLNNPE